MAGLSFSATGEWNGDRLARALYPAGQRGARKAGERLRALALPLTPIDRGNLRESATVETPNRTPEAFVVFDEPYAVIQHEELDYQHTEGQAKYLEQPLEEHRGELMAIMAKEVQVGILNA